uniref:Fungal lipase-type domain-containing protein n=1 Tax=viral metagenome TaxID=1070528 RepID=A0A6C0DQ19_9ZZZZ
MKSYFLYLFISSFLLFINRIATFSLEKANISAALSASAYCGKDNYNTLVWKEPANGFILTDIIYDIVNDLHGYVGILPSTQTIYIVFRGSDSIRNWIADFEFVKMKYLTFPECDCSVHNGFYSSAKNVIDDVAKVIQMLKTKYNYEIIVTGHSYGAAVAQLIAMELSAIKIEVAVYTFGQPRIGDMQFANFVNMKIKNVWRIVNNRDIVPHIPITTGLEYYHSCREVFVNESGDINICSESICEDGSCCRQYKIQSTNIIDHMIYLGHNMTCEY